MKRRIMSTIIFLIVISISSYFLYSTRILSRAEEETTIEDFNKHLEINEEKKRDSSSISIEESQSVIRGALFVPKIDLKLAIYDYDGEHSITKGAGILQGDLLGKIGVNTIITSHNGESFKDLFTNIIRLENGDKFYVKNEEDKILEYEVMHKIEVSPIGEADTFLVDKDQCLFTLRTCTPTGINTQRLHVTGKLLGEVKESDMQKPQLTFSLFEIVLIALSIISFIFIIINIVGAIKERKNHEN